MFKKISYYLPTLAQSWILALVLMLAGGIFANVISMILLWIFPGSEFITKCLSYALMFLPVILYIYQQGKKAVNEDKIIKINAPNFGKINPILFFILIFISSFAFSVAIDPLVSWMKAPEWFEEMMLKMLEGNIIYTFITIAILPPLLEEWLCRGIIMRGLLKHISPTKAIMWSALIFSVIHLNPWQAVPAFILGCFYGWIYYRTRSIWATIFMHFINNGFATLMFYYFPEIAMTDSLADILPDQPTYWMLVSISIGIISLTIFIIDKYTKPKNDEQNIPTEV